MRALLLAVILLIGTSASAQAFCTQLGNFTTCSDGTNYQQFGNTTFGSNSRTGTQWSQSQFGNTTFGSDSNGNQWSSTRLGNYVFGQDSNGNQFNCVRAGNTWFCN